MRFWTVDAFTDRPFSGNPAAICIVEKFPPDAFMQHVAMEMNLSETAFLQPLGANHFQIRWFTPKIEAQLCGHATLAASHVLRQEKLVNPGSAVHFDSLSGSLQVTFSGEAITLDFPAQVPTAEIPPCELIAALHITPIATARHDAVWLIEVENENIVRTLQPNLTLIASLPFRGVIVTARADANSTYDIVSRYFAPRAGINEDPVTGSAHCKLAPYWCEKINKRELHAYQASARGGALLLALQNDRVLLTGQAVMVMEGELRTKELSEIIDQLCLPNWT